VLDEWESPLKEIWIGWWLNCRERTTQILLWAINILFRYKDLINFLLRGAFWSFFGNIPRGLWEHTQSGRKTQYVITENFTQMIWNRIAYHSGYVEARFSKIG